MRVCAIPFLSNGFYVLYGIICNHILRNNGISGTSDSHSETHIILFVELSDYISWIAELACEFVYVDYSDGSAKLRRGQFGEAVSESVSNAETELNSYEIADFIVQINGTWTNVTVNNG
ncbi:MAG: hypothetical protein K2J39_01450 [Ruminococcus sp.]|nr:hypothetical protein [Ruminococcus sp.]